MSVVLRISDSSRTSRHFREGPKGDMRLLRIYGFHNPKDGVIGRRACG